ncbi:MAG: flavin-containing monooxygenase [Gaiellales bacterium]
MERVGIIGAGPAGIVAARYLLSEGFDPVLFERAPVLGGQWSGSAGTNGVWPSLHTNTSRVLTAFSDLPHDSDVVFLSNGEIHRYLERYARQFGVFERIRFSTPVERLDGVDGGWRLVTPEGEERFDRVLIASGRFHHPHIPHVPGLDAFTGSEGVLSTYHYKEPERYRGKRVLVGGCAVSALEIAADLAALGAASVVIAQRRQRYVLLKFAAGVPSDHRIFTRYGVLAAESLPLDEVGRQLKEIVLEAGGSPEQYGAPKPADDFFEAGVTLNQQYLSMVAEGRIRVRAWLDHVDGETVTFADGAREDFDAVIMGTGFELDLPFLSDELRATLDLDAQHANLDRHTFHPDLPGLAVLGMWDQSGGYFVPLELQARWVAYTWSGAVPEDSEVERRAAIAAYRDRRGQSQKTRMNVAALTFARAAGVEPDPAAWPGLERALVFGPLAPSSFRLSGHDALPDAAERFAAEVATFACIDGNELTEREARYLAEVAAARDDGTLARIAAG